MRLYSTYPDLNKEFYHFDLDTFPQSDYLEFKEVAFKNQDYTVDSTIHFNKDIVIIHNKRNCKKDLIEQVNVEGSFVLIAYLISGELEINQPAFRYLLDNDKLRIVFAQQTNNQVITPANCTTESILIYLRSSYLINLLKHEEWKDNNSIYTLINNDIGLTSVRANDVQVTHSIQKTILGIIQSTASSRIPKHLVGLKLRELLLRVYQNDSLLYDDENAPPHTGIQARITKALNYIEHHYLDTPTIQQVSRHVMLNEMQLKKEFKSTYGKTIRAYIIELKMKKAFELLKTNTIAETASILGYQSISYFTSTFKKYYKVLPSKIKNTK